MSQHIVIYRGADSKVGYHQTEDIHDAVSLVEQLRNEQGVERAKIFRLEEVNFEYRPYFRVELKAGGPSLGSAPAAAAVGAPGGEGATEVTETAAAASAATAPAATAPAAAAMSAPKAADTKIADAKPAEVKTPEVKLEEKVETPAPPAEAENGVSARRGLFGR